MVNQFAQVFTVREIAEAVREVAGEFGLAVRIGGRENPRGDKENHFYRPDCQTLRRMGYVPTGDLRETVREVLTDLLPLSERLAKFRRAAVTAETSWRGAALS
ncbi:MAG: hypothetical protein ACYCOU_08515 [Sulfobacillus sp.]